MGLPSDADSYSLSQPSTSAHSLAFTGSSCTISSFTTQNGDQDRGRTHARTMRTKDIQKSPLPHRFNLVPKGQARRSRHPPSPSNTPRSLARTKFSAYDSPLTDTDSLYAPKSPTPSLLSSPSSPEPGNRRSVLCSRPTNTCHGGRTQDPESFSPSLTLVHDPSNKSASFSPVSKPTHKLRGLALLESDHFSKMEDCMISAIVHGEDDACEMGEPSELPEQELAEEAALLRQHTTAIPAPSQFMHSLPSRSASPFFNASQSSSESVQTLSRRATLDGSSASFPHTPRKFALRRQAVYADANLSIGPFPDSDSDSSFKQHSSASKMSRGHAHTVSDFALPPSSAWSASTSVNSIRSDLEEPVAPQIRSTTLNDAVSSRTHVFHYSVPAIDLQSLPLAPERLIDGFSGNLDLPLSTLACDDDFMPRELALGVLTSTPPPEPRTRSRSRRRSRSRAARSSKPAQILLSTVDSTDNLLRLYQRDWAPWAPLSVTKKAAFRPSRTAPRGGRSPVVEHLMEQLDKAIAEWGWLSPAECVRLS
ncbi:uncharacterized protein BXZ73DRAFT_104450 [Epithele typhae]|uniref:uncharacterized protein n=1 Tax=Epithele typhae TaxID=378194 RepID=UPI0020086A4B|nr:uncharacterized protein BXZ73DRAFT_104450 [Epithele typhae]KAH9921567.1 hypothetical protein BXZ73DRAFT_104450 [Epithele typhae]